MGLDEALYDFRDLEIFWGTYTYYFYFEKEE